MIINGITSPLRWLCREGPAAQAPQAMDAEKGQETALGNKRNTPEAEGGAQQWEAREDLR